MLSCKLLQLYPQPSRDKDNANRILGGPKHVMLMIYTQALFQFSPRLCGSALSPWRVCP